MDNLKYDGTPDKRFSKRQCDTIVETSQILPYKNGYMQLVFIQRPINKEWIAVNNKAERTLK